MYKPKRNFTDFDIQSEVALVRSILSCVILKPLISKIFYRKIEFSTKLRRRAVYSVR